MDFFTLKHISLLLFMLSILSYQSHGRENFSKFTHVEKTDNVKNETKVPNEVDPLNKQNQEPEEEDPSFIPQTQSGYGLYGRNAPDEKTTTNPNNNDEGNAYYYNNNNGNKYNNDNNNNNVEFENVEEEDLSTDTSLLGNGGYTTPISSYDGQNGNYYNGDTRYNSQEQRNRRQYNNGDNTYSSEDEDQQYQEQENNNNLYNSNSHYTNGNRYNSNQQYNTENKYRYNTNNNNEQKQQYSNNVGNKYTEKQGMSDTRYLENGRYFYDINNEKNYNRNYNTDRYFQTNENAYEFDKSGDEYKNQYP